LTLVALLWAAPATRAQRVETGLRNRKGVLFFETFETAEWWKRWGLKRAPQNLQLVRDAAVEGEGTAAAKILFPRGEHYGSGWSWRPETGLEEAYLRYYVKFGEGFDFGRGGKTPGLMGWAPGKQAGWGGRRADGTNGFSTRVCWHRGGAIVMYTYHADQRTRFGDGFETRSGDGPARWEPGRWYCMELHMKLNTPGARAGERGRHDGLVELWQDGARIGRRDDVRFRDLATMKIDDLFVNAYFGGTWTSPKNQFVFYDNIVLSTGPIGPVGAGADGPKRRSGRFELPPGYRP
jgi:hypothetical protein